MFSVYTKLAVIGSTLWMVCLIQIDSSTTKQQRNLIENSSMDTPWRQTEFGWQNSNLWQHRATEAPAFSYIHPFVLSAAILLAVLGLMVWSSNETELASLTNTEPPVESKRQGKSDSD